MNDRNYSHTPKSTRNKRTQGFLLENCQFYTPTVSLNMYLFALNWLRLLSHATTFDTRNKLRRTLAASSDRRNGIAEINPADTCLYLFILDAGMAPNSITHTHTYIGIHARIFYWCDCVYNINRVRPGTGQIMGQCDDDPPTATKCNPPFDKKYYSLITYHMHTIKKSVRYE